MGTTGGPDPERLLAQTAWLRALARSLVRDPQVAEDLVQETWLVALDRPPGGEIPRSWLGGVVRNLARQLRRSDARRLRREEHAARPEATTERQIALCRAVVDAVQELPEPQRTTVLLRYFDELPPRRIARIQDVPVRTVNSRLCRARAQLRERLGRSEGGDRRDLGALLTPLLLVPVVRGRGSAAWIRWTAIPAAAALSILAIVTALGPESTGGSTAAAPEKSPAHSTLDSEIAPKSRRLVTGEGPPTEKEPRRSSVSGRVLDPAGRPVQDLLIEFAPGKLEQGTTRQLVHVGAEEVLDGEGPFESRSDADGRFRVSVPRTAGFLAPVGPEHAAFMQAEVTLDHWEDEHLVIVAPPRTLHGVVRDDSGEPVAGAVVMLRWPQDFVLRFPEPIPTGRPVSWKRMTDAQGRWTLENAPVLEGAWLQALHAAYEPGEADAPPRGDTVEITILRKGVWGESVSGFVVDAEGGAVAGAFVGAGRSATTSGSDGAFAVAIVPDGGNVAITAIAPGYLPVVSRVERMGASILRLDRRAPSLRGRVVDERGVGRPGLWVWIADPTPIGNEGRLPVLAENLLASDSPVLWRRVETDADGGFELGPVLEREYSLRVMDPETVDWIESAAVAGTGAPTIAFPRATPDSLTGRVTDPHGRPLGSIRVVTTKIVLRIPTPGSAVPFEVTHRGPSATTDERGRFALAPLARAGTRLDIVGSSVLPESVLLQEDSPSQLALVVSRRAYVRVVTDLAGADGFSVFDADGALLTAVAYLTGSVYAEERVRMFGGRSAIVAVPETARTVVLYAGERELARTDFAADVREVVTLRL